MFSCWCSVWIDLLRMSYLLFLFICACFLLICTWLVFCVLFPICCLVSCKFGCQQQCTWLGGWTRLVVVELGLCSLTHCLSVSLSVCNCVEGEPKKCSNTKITISQKCVNIFIPSFAHLFTRQLCKSVLLCAVFTWHTPSWRKRKLQEPIL